MSAFKEPVVVEDRSIDPLSTPASFMTSATPTMLSDSQPNSVFDGAAELDAAVKTGTKSNMRNRVVSSVRWALVESILGAVAGLLSTLIIGHLIEPTELGRAGAAMAVINLIELAAAFGIGEALVRSRSFHTSLTDSAYVGLIVLSCLGALVCCAVALPIAWIYNDHRVGALIAVGSLLLPLSAIDIVPIAILTRKMRIDVLAKRGILSKGATVVSAAALAYAGFGAWSILGCTFIGSALASFSLIGSIRRWPKFHLNWSELRGLIAFGGPISLELVIVSVTTRLFSLLFGVFHGLEALGYLQFAQRLIDEIANLIQNFTFRFGLSYFARVERAGEDPTEPFLLGTKMITFVGAPVLLGFAAVSGDALLSIIGSRWLPSIDFIVVAALGWSAVMPTILLSPALRARGLQKALVSTSVLNCFLALLACVLTARGSEILVAMAFGARHLMVLPSAVWMARRYLKIPIRRYVSAFAVPLCWAIVMAATVWALRAHIGEMSPLLRLLLAIAGGGVFYLFPVLALDRKTLQALRPFVIRRTADV